jgi:hypothetical protein
MADQSATVDFWLDVQRLLQTEFQMSADQARTAIDGYRRCMLNVGALDVVYHWEPGDIARAIQGGRFTEELSGR